MSRQTNRVRPSHVAYHQRTHLVALICAGAAFKNGFSSNETKTSPTTDQEANSKSHNTPLHRS